MKLSPNTIKLLDNFSNISNTMCIEPGNVISVMSAAKNIVAYAEVEEHFPEKVNIPRVAMLLHTMNVLKDPELHFFPGKNFYKIKGKNGDVDLAICDDRVSDPFKGKKLDLEDKMAPDIDIHFPADILHTCRKIASTIKLDSIVVTNIEGQISIVIKNNDVGSSSDKYIFETGVDIDEEFVYMIDAANLKNIPGDYNLKIFGGRVAQFKHTDHELYYWVSLEANED